MNTSLIVLNTPTLETELLYAVMWDDAEKAESVLSSMTPEQRYALDVNLNHAAKLTNLYRQRYDK